MRSFLGTLVSLQEAAVYHYSKDYEDAERALREARSVYKGLKVKIFNLSNAEDRIEIIDIDPDMGQFKEGYVVIVKIPENPLSEKD
ncbi:hypothetical protein V6M85_10460 [Sulfolobus tengchongensis]|uniref:Uncharacterized protein n=1 Tax=Sulfolobus tengchongensis TaxID=207809 RepID=A0AAX4KY89_9CREN